MAALQLLRNDAQPVEGDPTEEAGREHPVLEAEHEPRGHVRPPVQRPRLCVRRPSKDARAPCRVPATSELVGNVVVVADEGVVVARETTVRGCLLARGLGVSRFSSTSPPAAHPGRGAMPATRTSPVAGSRSATSGAVKRAERLPRRRSRHRGRRRPRWRHHVGVVVQGRRVVVGQVGRHGAVTDGTAARPPRGASTNRRRRPPWIKAKVLMLDPSAQRSTTRTTPATTTRGAQQRGRGDGLAEDEPAEKHGDRRVHVGVGRDHRDAGRPKQPVVGGQRQDRPDQQQERPRRPHPPRVAPRDRNAHPRRRRGQLSTVPPTSIS